MEILSPCQLPDVSSTPIYWVINTQETTVSSLTDDSYYIEEIVKGKEMGENMIEPLQDAQALRMRTLKGVSSLTLSNHLSLLTMYVMAIW